MARKTIKELEEKIEELRDNNRVYRNKVRDQEGQLERYKQENNSLKDFRGEFHKIKENMEYTDIVLMGIVYSEEELKKLSEAQDRAREVFRPREEVDQGALFRNIITNLGRLKERFKN